MTQEELAANLGKSQSTIANKLRLLNLDESVQTALLNEKISERHARSLLNITEPEKQRELLDRVILNRMTVRALDDEIAKITGKQVIPEENETQNQVEQINTNNEPIFTMPETSEITSTTIENGAANAIEYNHTPQDNPFTNIRIEQPIVNEIQNINQPKQQEEPKINIFESLRIEPEEEKPKIFTNQEIEELEERMFREIRNQGQEINKQEPINNNTIKQPENIFASPNPVGSIPVQQPTQEQINSDIYDLRFAINNVRQAVQNTKKFGFTIETEEFDFENAYQIIIKIDKNK